MLEDRAAQVLAGRRASTSDPLVIEFAGSPKAGKSTTIDILTHFFKRRGYRVWAPTEGASKRTPFYLKRDLVAFNTWTLNYAISELLVAFHNVEPQDLIILDRGPFDSLAWMRLLVDRGELDETEYTTIRDFALHPRWVRLIRRVYLFTCEPDTSLARETASKLTTEGGTAMNAELLKQLLERYRRIEHELAEYPVKAVSTSSETTSQGTSYAIAVDLLDLFEGTR